MQSQTVACPLCGQTATITMYEQIDSAGGTEGHRVEFQCVIPSHHLDEPAMLRLYAAERTRGT